MTAIRDAVAGKPLDTTNRITDVNAYDAPPAGFSTRASADTPRDDVSRARPKPLGTAPRSPVEGSYCGVLGAPRRSANMAPDQLIRIRADDPL
jgi:hypothetical protein